MTDVIKEAKAILNKGHMIETGEGILHLKADLEVTATQDSHTKDRIIIEMEDGGDRRQQSF